MRSRFICLRVALAGAVVLGASSFTHLEAAQQFGAAEAERLSGVWMKEGRTAGASAVISREVPPLTDLGQERLNANKPMFGPRAVHGGLSNDPMLKCDPMGLVRLLVNETKRPWEFIPLSDRVLQLFEWGQYFRIIWTDGRTLPDPDLGWPLQNQAGQRIFGYSVGEWQGDTFVVESVGFDERFWLDNQGRPYSAEMRLEERYRPVDRDTMEVTVTLTDPATYTRPWEGTIVYHRLNDWEMGETVCIPSDEELYHRTFTP